VAVFPNDIGGLGRLNEFHFLTHNLMTFVRVSDIKGKICRVIRFEGDESCCGNGKRLEFLEEFGDFRFFLSHFVEFLSGDGSTTGSEGSDKL